MDRSGIYIVVPRAGHDRKGYNRRASEELMSDNRARQELRDWTRVRGYWDRVAESLELAANASDPDVQDRYVTIAQHYRTLADG